MAGESLIFEGTEGLPAQIAKHLQSRQLSVTLGEQFTGGLLALQLSRVNAPLLASEVVPFQQETLAQTARWASERRVNHFAGLALFVRGWMRNISTLRWLAGRDACLKSQNEYHPPQSGGVRTSAP